MTSVTSALGSGGTVINKDKQTTPNTKSPNQQNSSSKANDEKAFHNLLSKWKTTNNDEHRLAILMLVVKLLSKLSNSTNNKNDDNNNINEDKNSEDIDTDQVINNKKVHFVDEVENDSVRSEHSNTFRFIQDVYNVVGLSFINRLLNTTKAPEGCSPTMFQELSLSLLATFSRLPEICEHADLKSKIPIFTDFIGQYLDESDDLDEDDINAKMLCLDSFECLIGISRSESGISSIISYPQLIKLIFDGLHNDVATESSKKLLLHIVHRKGSELCLHNSKTYAQGCIDVALEISERTDQTKFQLCTLLSALISCGNIQNNPEVFLEIKNNPTFWDALRHCLVGVFRSKHIPEYKRICLILLADLSLLWGLDWFENDKGEILSSTIILCCLEIRMIIDDSGVEEILENEQLLMSCFLVLEKSFEILFQSNPPTLFASFVVNHTRYPLNDAFKAILRMIRDERVLHYMEAHKDDLPAVSIVLATVRLLSVWLAEDTENLRPEVLETLPSLFQLSEPQNCFGNSILEFLLPGLCHLTSDSNNIKNVLKCQGHFLIRDYVSNNIDEAEKSIEVTTALNIFLNFLIVDEKKIIFKNEFCCFQSLFMALTENVSQDFICEATSSTVCCFIIRIFSKNFFKQPNFEGLGVEFFSHVGDLVARALMILSKDDATVDFESVVNLIMIILQNLMSSISHDPSLRALIFKSTLFPTLMNWLNNNKIPQSDNMVYQSLCSLLVTTAKTCEKGRNLIIANNGRTIALNNGIGELIRTLCV